MVSVSLLLSEENATNISLTYIADLIAKELGTSLLADNSLFGPMVAVELPLPPRFAKTDIVTSAIELKKYLYDQHKIEVRMYRGFVAM